MKKTKSTEDKEFENELRKVVVRDNFYDSLLGIDSKNYIFLPPSFVQKYNNKLLSRGYTFENCGIDITQNNTKYVSLRRPVNDTFHYKDDFPVIAFLPFIIITLPIIGLIVLGFVNLKIVLSNYFQIPFIIISWILFIIFFIASKDDKHTRIFVLLLGLIYFGLTMTVLLI